MALFLGPIAPGAVLHSPSFAPKFTAQLGPLKSRAAHSSEMSGTEVAKKEPRKDKKYVFY